MARKWSYEKNVEFIELYENYPCLWDVKNDLYKNKLAREVAYNEIAVKMGGEPEMDVRDVKSKIRIFRNTYNLELSKIKKSMRSGMSADEVYKPKVGWFDIMNRILKNVAVVKEVSEYITINSRMQESPDEQELDKDSTISTTAVSSKHTPPSKRLKVLPDASALRKAVESLQTISNRLDKKEENEFEVFGRNVALQLQKLPLKEALETQEMIQKVLREQRLKHLNAVTCTNKETNQQNHPYKY